MARANIEIKVDSQDAQSNIPKALRLLGAMEDEFGRLRSKNGELIGSLSAARVKMGEYVDEQGRVHNANGQLIEGLTATQKALKMYVDEAGNVCDVYGNIVKESDAVAEKLRAQEEAAGKMGEAWGSFASVGNQIGTVVAILGQGNEGMTKAQKAIVATTTAGSTFLETMKGVTAIIKAYNTLTTAMEGATAAQAILSAMSGNWFALAAGAVAGGVTFWSLMADDTQDAADATKDAATETDKLAEAWRRVNREMTTATDKAKSVAAGVIAGLSETQTLPELLNAIATATEEKDSISAPIAPANLSVPYATGGGGAKAADDYNKQLSAYRKRQEEADKRITEAKEAYAQAVSDFIAANKPKRTETETALDAYNTAMLVYSEALKEGGVGQAELTKLGDIVTQTQADYVKTLHSATLSEKKLSGIVDETKKWEESKITQVQRLTEKYWELTALIEENKASYEEQAALPTLQKMLAEAQAQENAALLSLYAKKDDNGFGAIQKLNEDIAKLQTREIELMTAAIDDEDELSRTRTALINAQKTLTEKYEDAYRQAFGWDDLDKEAETNAEKKADTPERKITRIEEKIITYQNRLDAVNSIDNTQNLGLMIRRINAINEQIFPQTDKETLIGQLQTSDNPALVVDRFISALNKNIDNLSVLKIDTAKKAEKEQKKDATKDLEKWKYEAPAANDFGSAGVYKSLIAATSYQNSVLNYLKDVASSGKDSADALTDVNSNLSDLKSNVGAI